MRNYILMTQGDRLIKMWANLESKLIFCGSLHTFKLTWAVS